MQLRLTLLRKREAVVDRVAGLILIVLAIIGLWLVNKGRLNDVLQSAGLKAPPPGTHGANLIGVLTDIATTVINVAKPAPKAP